MKEWNSNQVLKLLAIVVCVCVCVCLYGIWIWEMIDSLLEIKQVEMLIRNT